MKILQEIFLFTKRAIEACLRNPVFIFMGVATPIIYLVLFTPLLNTLISNGGIDSDNVMNLFIPGMLPIISFSTGIFTGFGMIDEIRSGVIERFRVTPASRFSILFGPVLFDLLTVFFQSIFFIVIALPFGFRANLLGMIILFLFLALLTCTTSAFGNAIALIVKNEDRYAPIIHGINLPVLLLSGTLLPMSLAPKWLNILVHFNPVYYVVEASRLLVKGKILSSIVFYALLVLVFFTTISLLWATNIFKKVIT